MSSPMRKVIMFALAGVAVLLIATLGYTFGQGGTSTSQSDVGVLGMPAEESAVQMAGEDAGSKSGYDAVDTAQRSASSPPASLENTDRLIVRTANMEVRVQDVDSAVARIRAAALRHGAEISDLSLIAGEAQVLGAERSMPDAATRGPATAYITLRVPAQKLEALQAQIAKLGVVVTQSANANDVTEQAIDMEARLKNLRAEEARLRTFLDKTDDVTELLEVERELARVRGEIESMDAQLTYLKRQVARSTLAVTLSEPGAVVQPAGPTWGLREAVTRGIQAAAAMITTLVTVAIPLALLAVLIGIAAWPVRAVLRRRASRHKADTVDSAPTTDEAPE